MGNHYIAKCKHGTMVSQCRCISKDKEVRIVPCPSWCKAVKEMTSSPPTKPEWCCKTLKEFIDKDYIYQCADDKRICGRTIHYCPFCGVKLDA